jgi:hypothetical protein
MPDSEPDPKKFYMGGCTSEGEWHKYKCIKCGWEGSLLEGEGVNKEGSPYKPDFPSDSMQI